MRRRQAKADHPKPDISSWRSLISGLVATKKKKGKKKGTRKLCFSPTTVTAPLGLVQYKQGHVRVPFLPLRLYFCRSLDDAKRKGCEMQMQMRALPSGPGFGAWEQVSAYPVAVYQSDAIAGR